MNSTAIYIKTEPEAKEREQKVAKELRFSLSSLMNAWLKQLVRTKTINFTLIDEDPNQYLLRAMKKAEKNRKSGKASPVFHTPEDAIDWLEKQGV